MSFLHTVPPHLTETSWLDFELAQATGFCHCLRREFTQLGEKLNGKHVHDSRVALRRWMAIWAVLEEDGWESSKYHKKIGKKLKRLRRKLGTLRDLDVVLQTGRELDCSQRLLQSWADQRMEARTQVKLELQKTDAQKLITRLETYLSKRAQKMAAQLAENINANPEISAYERINHSLTIQEQIVKKQESLAKTGEELHQLRIAIKHWRYLLTEFFGLTNIQLVKAQQYLGKLNDFHRLKTMMAGHNEPEANRQIAAEMQLLQLEFDHIRKDLPFGLRPALISRNLQLSNSTEAGKNQSLSPSI